MHRDVKGNEVKKKNNNITIWADGTFDGRGLIALEQLEYARKLTARIRAMEKPALKQGNMK